MDAGEPIPYSAGAAWGDANALEQRLVGRVVDPAARENLPNEGEVGMAYEYDSGNGGRSNHNYVLEGLLPMLPTSFVLKALSNQNPELWPLQSRPDEVEEVERRIEVGMTDIIYKGTHGYFSYDYRKLVTDTTSGEWRYYDVEYDRPASAADKQIAQQEFPVIRAYNAPRIGYDYLIGLYQAMFENRKGYAYQAAIRLYSDFDASVPLRTTSSLKVGDLFTAVVEVDEVSQLMGMDLAVKYDMNHVAVVTVDGRKRVSQLVPSLDIIAMDNELDEVQGSIRFSGVSKGYTATGSYRNKQLYKIEFEVKQRGKDFGISLDERVFPGGLRFVDAGNHLFAPTDSPPGLSTAYDVIFRNGSLIMERFEHIGEKLQDRASITLPDHLLDGFPESLQEVILHLENAGNKELEIQIPQRLVAELVKRDVRIILKTASGEFIISVETLEEFEGNEVRIDLGKSDDGESEDAAPVLIITH
jgi:hypothetical protein